MSEDERVYAKMLSSLICEAIFINHKYGEDCKEVQFIRALWNNESFNSIVSLVDCWYTNAYE